MMLRIAILMVMSISSASLYAGSEERLTCKILATESTLAEGVRVDAFQVDLQELNYIREDRNPMLADLQFEEVYHAADFPGVEFDGLLLVNANFEKWTKSEPSISKGIMLMASIDYYSDRQYRAAIYSAANNFSSVIVSDSNLQAQFYCQPSRGE